MRKNLFKLSLVAVAALTAVRCETLNIGGGGTTKPTAESPVAGLTVAPTLVQVEVGKSVQFVAAISIKAQGASEAVTWRSIDPGIATVDNTGLARCVAAGVTVIAVTAVADPSSFAAASLLCVAAAAPPLFNVTPGTVEVDVDRNATNLNVCAFRVQSSGGAVTFTFKSDHPALAAAVPSGSIPAGGFVFVNVFYNGPAPAPFSTTVRFVATSPQGTQEVQVPVKIGFKE